MVPKLFMSPNTPVPLEVQVPPPAKFTFPASVITELFPQTTLSNPAFTCGAGVKSIVISSVTWLQLPFEVDFRVSVTLPKPPLMSAAEGVYIGFTIFAFEKAPVPLDVQVAPKGLDTDPFNCTFALFAHLISLIPAFTIGAGV